jgi:hypothetical protein
MAKRAALMLDSRTISEEILFDAKEVALLLWELGPGLALWLVCTSGIVGVLYWLH